MNYSQPFDTGIQVIPFKFNSKSLPGVLLLGIHKNLASMTEIHLFWLYNDWLFSDVGMEVKCHGNLKWCTFSFTVLNMNCLMELNYCNSMQILMHLFAQNSDRNHEILILCVFFGCCFWLVSLPRMEIRQLSVF